MFAVGNDLELLKVIGLSPFYHFLLVVSGNNDSIWHRYRDIITYA